MRTPATTPSPALSGMSAVSRKKLLSTGASGAGTTARGLNTGAVSVVCCDTIISASTRASSTLPAASAFANASYNSCIVAIKS